MPVIAPPHQHAKVRQNRIVQNQHVQRLQGRSQGQDQHSHNDEFGAVILPERRGVAFHQVHDATHVVNQSHFDGGHDDGHDSGTHEKRAELTRE